MVNEGSDSAGGGRTCVDPEEDRSSRSISRRCELGMALMFYQGLHGVAKRCGHGGCGDPLGRRVKCVILEEGMRVLTADDGAFRGWQA